MGTLTLPLPLTLQLRTMKGGVVTNLRLIVFLPSILVLWDDKGTLAGSIPQMHDNSQSPKFLVLDKPGGKKSLIEIEGKTGRKESVQKQTGHKSSTPDCSDWPCFEYSEPTCGSDGKTYPTKCDLKRTAACEDGKQDLIIASEGPCSGARNHDYSDIKCSFEGKEYMPGVTRYCDCTFCKCLETGDWKPTIDCDDWNIFTTELSSNNNEGSADGIADLSEPHETPGHKSGTPDCSSWGCFFILRPVCGSDGKTYSNPCLLNYNAACTDGKQDLVIASEGECSGESGARMMNG